MRWLAQVINEVMPDLWFVLSAINDAAVVEFGDSVGKRHDPIVVRDHNVGYNRPLA